MFGLATCWYAGVPEDDRASAAARSLAVWAAVALSAADFAASAAAFARSAAI